MFEKRGLTSYTLIGLVIALTCLLSAVSSAAFQPASDESHNCRLWGIIAEQAPDATIQSHLITLPNSLENLSPANTDGWGIGYYVGADLEPSLLRGYPAAHLDPNFDVAVATVAAATPRVALAHVRNASTGGIPATGDPHPFERVMNGRHWLFEHNGTVDKTIVLSLIRPEFIAAHPPLYGDISTNWNAVIDSDLYFLFLLQTLQDFNWQVKPALGYAIKKLRDALPGTDERLNFLLTDGITLWGYRQGGASYTLYYQYNSAGTPYSAIASQYPTSSQGDWVLMQSGEIVTLRQSGAPILESIEDYFGETLIVDNNFDVSSTSAELRAAGGWYESRGENPALLTLNESLIGGNGSKKAALAASATNNSYLSQQLASIPTGQVSLRWDIYVDNILDGADRDRAALQLVGQDIDGTNGPNSTSTERFVFLAFYAPGGAESGLVNLIAREPGDDYANSSAWLTVAEGLELDRWYTIQVDCDLTSDTYDVYVNGALRRAGVQGFTPVTQLTHVSFAQWNDGSGGFYVDNVYEGLALNTRTLTIAANPVSGGTTTPAAGNHNFADGDVVAISAVPAVGYQFDFWTGNVADPSQPTTTVVMDDDQTVTARFSLIPVSFLADNGFSASADGDALRSNGPGQDWYESRADNPLLVTLSTDNVGANGTAKAAFAASATNNAYLSQEFGQPQSGTFSVSWDIYMDEILDRSGPDYSGWMLIGDDADGIRGPNSTGSDRFVYLAFEKDGGGTSGTMDLVAREPGAAWDAFTTLASGLNLDQWYTVGVTGDVAAGTYDVYLNGNLLRADIPAFTGKAALTNISFAQWNDGSGSFFVDNVHQGYVVQLASAPPEGGSTVPASGSHLYAEGTELAVEAIAASGFEFDFWEGNVTDPSDLTTTLEVISNETITANFNELAIPLLADREFDQSPTSEDLRANGSGQDWYESRGQYPTLLTLNTDALGGNSGNKAGFAASASYNAYLSQEFSAPQTSTFSLEWDIYVDNILDNSTGDRAAFQLVGQEIDGTSGPNSTSTERFVFLAFWAEGGATSGTMNLIAREPGDTYNTSSAWALIASGLAVDAWHHIKVVGDVNTDTYDVYVNGVLARAGVLAYAPMAQVTHLSFAQWNDGSGAFYVDNVGEPVAQTYALTLAVDPAGSGSTNPAIGVHQYPEGDIVTITANTASGYQFDRWEGDVVDPFSSSTTVEMNADKSVTALFSSAPVALVADGLFDVDATSTLLRANGPGQDWYESRGANPELLELNNTNIGGNSSNKAKLIGSPAGNTYLSQELGQIQSETFALQWDIFVEEILDISSPDRAGWMLIGDDTDPARPGPNSDPSERFVQMAFFRDGGGTAGTMSLVARERGASFTSFATVASGLQIGQWYTIKVVCNLQTDTYDVYLNELYQATLTSYAAKSSISHVSFGQWNDGAGTFYVDNVQESELPPTHHLTIAVDPFGSADTDPAIGDHEIPIGATIAVSATAHVGYQFDHWSGNVVDPNSATTQVMMDADKSITAYFTEVPIVFLADAGFDASTSSADLRADGAGQDWYESRGDQPDLVSLVSDPVGGNSGPKAFFRGSTSGNVYLSQEFGAPQTGLFAAQWEVYVDEILNISNPDRTGWMLIGDNTNSNRPGPNSDPDERFVQMAFFRDGGGTSGTMDLVARERGATFENFTTVATGLTMDEWHLIKVVCDLEADEYAVYVDGVYRSRVSSYTAKSEVTHISFGQWNDGAGSFYVDNIQQSTLPATYVLSLDVNPLGAGTTEPVSGNHNYLEGTVTQVEAISSSGYVFTHWTGDVADPTQAVTNVIMNGDKAITANFAPGIGSISGIVRSASTPLRGVYIDLFSPTGTLYARSITDESGHYALLNLPADHYRMVIQRPFGCSVTGGIQQMVRVGEGEVVHDLDLPVAVSGGIIDFWGWKREILAIATSGTGSYQMTRAQIDGYLQSIFDAYYNRGDGHEIRILNVTFTGDPARAMTLDDVVYQWETLVDNSIAQKGRKYLLADLLNVVADRQSQLAVASADGALVTQALRSLSEQFLAGPVTGSMVTNISLINQNRTIPAGIVNLTTPTIMYGGFGVTSHPPIISCPAQPIAVQVCGPDHICVPLAIQDYGEVIVTPAPASWSAGQLCFDFTEVRDYTFHITAIPAEAGYNPAECDITIALQQIPAPVIVAPTETVEIFACDPGQQCIDLAVTNYTSVSVTGATWSANRLCFAADTSGLYSFVVTATNTCTSVQATCEVQVTLGQPVVITCPAEPLTEELCTAGQVCVDLPIANETDVQVTGATWADDKLCFTADTAGLYTFEVLAVNACGNATCNLSIQVGMKPLVAIVCPTEPPMVYLCGPGEACIDLAVHNHSEVTVEGGTWSDGRLCFAADTAGLYTFVVNASNECGATSCDLSVQVLFNPIVAIECPVEPIAIQLCAAGEACVSLPIVNQSTVVIEGAHWNAGRLCFQADTSGLYQYHVSSANPCQETSCDLTVQVTILPVVQITCPTAPLAATICEPGPVCIPLSVANQSDVQVTGGIWSGGQLCFDADTAGTYLLNIVATNDCGTATCDVSVGVTLTPSVVIQCPTETVESTTCWPGAVCITLPILNQTEVTVEGGTWAEGQLCINAATSGIHIATVSARNGCTSATCEVSVAVSITGIDLYIAADDVTLLPPKPQPGENVVVTANVHNDARSSEASNLVVRFFDGDPSNNLQIGEDQVITSLPAGEAAAAQIEYVVTEPLPRDIWVVIDPEQAIVECSEENNTAAITIESTPLAADIFGTVRTTAIGLHGVQVLLLDNLANLVGMAVTDEDGLYRLEEVPSGHYSVRVDLPMGFKAITQGSVPIDLAGFDAEVNFELSFVATSSILDFWTWKRDILTISEGGTGVYIRTRQEVDGYLQILFDSYYDRNDGHEIRIQNVTHTGIPARALTLDDVVYEWHLSTDNSQLQKGRKYLLADLLNIASGRLGQLTVVSADGASATQAIRYFADRFQAATVDAQLVTNISRIHQRITIPAGVIPLSTPIVVYKANEGEEDKPLPTSIALSQNYPNPFNPSTEISYSLPTATHVTLEVYNLTGQRVATLVDTDQATGTHTVRWDASQQASGVYMYRLSAGDFVETKKMLLIK